MNQILEFLGEGTQATELTVLQVCLRAVIIFIAALWIVRVASKRFFAKRTAFDFILGLVLASMLARSINGSEPMIPTIAGGFTLALLHRSLGWMGVKWPRFGKFIKSGAEVLVRDGQLDRRMMHTHHIGDDDLLEDLRLNGLTDPSAVKLATLERSGDVSVVRNE